MPVPTSETGFGAPYFNPDDVDELYSVSVQLSEGRASNQEASHNGNRDESVSSVVIEEAQK